MSVNSHLKPVDVLPAVSCIRTHFSMNFLIFYAHKIISGAGGDVNACCRHQPASAPRDTAHAVAGRRPGVARTVPANGGPRGACRCASLLCCRHRAGHTSSRQAATTFFRTSYTPLSAIDLNCRPVSGWQGVSDSAGSATRTNSSPKPTHNPRPSSLPQASQRSARRS